MSPYLLPEYQLELIKQRERELIQRAERARLVRGVRPVGVHVRLRAVWNAFHTAGLTDRRATVQR